MPAGKAHGENREYQVDVLLHAAINNGRGPLQNRAR